MRELVAAHQHDGGDRQRQEHAAQPADAMRQQADAQHRHHAHELAAHEQRADLGVGDAAVAQPHRPVAHEGAGGEEVGRAVAGEPPALDDALHQAANSRRTWSVCWPSSARRPAARARRRRRRRGRGSRRRPWARRSACGGAADASRDRRRAHPRPGDLRGVEPGRQIGEALARQSSSARSRWCRRAARCAPCWWRSRDPSPGPACRARRGRGARTRGRSGSRSAPAPCRPSGIDAIGRDERMGEAEPRPFIGRVVHGEQRHGHPFGHRGEQRDRDGAALAGLLPRQQRLEHGGMGVHAGADVGRRDADPARRMLGAGDRGQPALGLHQQVVGAAVLVGSVIAVARDVDRDQPLVCGPHRGRAEARAVGGAGREVLDQHVGLADQAMQQREIVGLA